MPSSERSGLGSRQDLVPGLALPSLLGSAGFTPVSPDRVPPTLFARRKYWAQRFGIAPFLPTTRAEMDELGWDSCDVILVTGDAYVDHPSFGMAIVGRAARGAGLPRRHHRAARLAQRRRRSRALGPAEPVLRHHRRQHGLDGQPLHVGPPDPPRRRVHAGRRGRQAARSRGDRLRAALPRGVQRTCRIVIGGIEASLRRIAHYDYWSRQGAPLGAARRARPTCWCSATPSGRSSRSRIAWRPASRSTTISDLRGTAFVRRRHADGLDRDRLDARSMRPGRVDPHARSVRDGSARSQATAPCATRAAAGARRRERRAASRAASARPIASAASSACLASSR